MSWKVKEEHADLSLKRHYIVLEESLTGEQHHVAIYFNSDQGWQFTSEKFTGELVSQSYEGVRFSV